MRLANRLQPRVPSQRSDLPAGALPRGAGLASQKDSQARDPAHQPAELPTRGMFGRRENLGEIFPRHTQKRPSQRTTRKRTPGLQVVLITVLNKPGTVSRSLA